MKWLIFDCNYLCHRAKHVFGELSYGDNYTGVTYGFLKDINYYQTSFDADNVIFCWDSKSSKRRELYSTYKANRIEKQKEWNEEEIKQEQEFKLQILKLRKVYLKELGYKNIFCQKGYESDDLIASLCKSIPQSDEIVIISADHDLYQLLRSNVSMYSPQARKLLTLQGFTKKYNIPPKLWVDVKCLAGCDSDNVEGIKGVGEKTAIKYLLNQLKETSKIYKTIQNNINRVCLKNRILVKLPFEGTKTFELRPNEVTNEKWKRVKKKLGIKSL